MLAGRVALYLAFLASPHTDVSHSWDQSEQLALDAFVNGRYAEAELHLKDAIALVIKDRGKETERASLLNTLGAVQLAARKFNAASETYLEAYRIRVTELGPRHMDVEQVARNLAQAYTVSGRYKDAERYYSVSWHVRRLNEKDDEASKADLLSHLGRLYLSAGRFDDAEVSCRDALAIRKKDGQDAVKCAADHKTLGILYTRLGKLDQAKEAFEQASADEFSRPWLRLEWGRYYLAKGDSKRADEILTSADSDEEKKGKPNPLFLARVRESRAIAYSRNGDNAKARELLIASLATFKSFLGESHSEYADALMVYCTLFPDDSGEKLALAMRIRAALKKQELRGVRAVLESSR